MMTSRFLCAAFAAAIFLPAAAAQAVAEAEPSEAEPTEAAEPVAASADMGTPEPAEPGRVERSAFTSLIADREPTDTLTTVSNEMDRVLYFTELRGLEGRTVVHRWQYGGEVMAEIPFQVGGPRWRVHSSKRLDSSWVGEWTVSVMADGEVLTSEHFTYAEASAEPKSETGQATEPNEPAPPAAAAE